MPAEVIVLDDAAAVAAEGARRFVDSARRAVAQRGRFTVALAGGSTPAGLYANLARMIADVVPWRQTQLFFGDERCVSPDHAWSNFRMVRETLLDRIEIPEWQVFRMLGEGEPDEAAAAYAEVIRATLDGVLPRFDLILLGVGEDGHTASLFPGMPALAVDDMTVTASEVPAYVQPQIRRLTLTFPVLNAAHHVILLATGPKKAHAVARSLGETGPTERVPAGRVQPVEGGLTWLIDREANSRRG